MAMGYCRTCGKLVAITPGQMKYAGAREQWWYPVAHDAGGKLCSGSKKGI